MRSFGQLQMEVAQFMNDMSDLALLVRDPLRVEIFRSNTRQGNQHRTEKYDLRYQHGCGAVAELRCDRSTQINKQSGRVGPEPDPGDIGGGEPTAGYEGDRQDSNQH